MSTPPSSPRVSSALAVASTSSPPTIHELAAKALAGLDAIEAMLDLDIVIRPKEKSQMSALNRVSDAAIDLASDIVTAMPDRFPDFAALPDAATYVQVMTAVAARATELATHVTNSIQNQRAPAANTTLVLYGVVKHLGRLVENETMREKVAFLKEEITPRRGNRPPPQTKSEKAAKAAVRQRNARIARAKALLAKAGAT